MFRSVGPAPWLVDTAHAVKSSPSYVVATTAELPTIDTSITLGAALIGGVSDASMNARLIRLATKYNVWMYVLAPLACSACTAVFFTHSRSLSLVLSALTVGCMTPMAALTHATLSRDLVRLSAQSFEFWFLTSNAPKLRNHVFLHATVFEIPIHMEANSMLVSRIVTIWFWMGRFLWHELLYPRDAFKLFKRSRRSPSRQSKSRFDAFEPIRSSILGNQLENGS